MKIKIKTENKIKIVQVGLVGLAMFLLTIGLGHIFFPELSHEIVGQKAFDPEHPFMAAAAREMGILFSVLGIASLIAAFNPLKHKWLVFVVVLSSALSDLNRASAASAVERLWIVMVISIVLWLLIVIFYPYRNYINGK